MYASNNENQASAQWSTKKQVAFLATILAFIIVPLYLPLFTHS